MRVDKTTSQEIKKINRNSIYNLILQDGSVSKQDLVYKLQLSLPTITQNLIELLTDGLICENGSFGNTGGRRARAYSIVPDVKLALGMDITKHHITIVSVDIKGNIINKKRTRCNFSMEDEYLQNIGNIVDHFIKDTQISEDKILGVGIAVPGLITEDHQKVFYGKILNFTGMTSDNFGKYIKYYCNLHNDANAAGYAEMWSDPELKNAFYISLSNNIGGSVIINNQIYKGEGPRSGEVGHITIIPGGPECYCGQKGCFETYCAATKLSDCAEGNLDEFFRLLNEGNKNLRKIWSQYLQYLSIAVNNVRMLFDCKIILGGYVGGYMDAYIEDLRTLAAERNTFEDNADYLQVCKYKKEAIAVGAALPYIDQFIKNI